MSFARKMCFLVLLAVSIFGCQRGESVTQVYDMHGNTCESCRDWFHAKLPGGLDPDLYTAKATALKNRTGDYSRVRRGGTWADDGWPNRSAFRPRFEPERRYDHVGFRIVAVQP